MGVDHGSLPYAELTSAPNTTYFCCFRRVMHVSTYASRGLGLYKYVYMKEAWIAPVPTNTFIELCDSRAVFSINIMLVLQIKNTTNNVHINSSRLALGIGSDTSTHHVPIYVHVQYRPKSVVIYGLLHSKGFRRVYNRHSVSSSSPLIKYPHTIKSKLYTNRHRRSGDEVNPDRHTYN